MICFHLRDYHGNCTNFGYYTQMCNDQASTDNWGSGSEHMHLSRGMSRWHVGIIAGNGKKHLPRAVLNHNTSYQASIGCEPTRVLDGRIHGRNPYNILNHKLGNNQNEQITPSTDFCEEIQNRTKQLIDKTEQKILHSFHIYKEYYDRKARAAPLKKKDYWFVLQPKADHKGSKVPFREYCWVGPFIMQKVLPNRNYI